MAEYMNTSLGFIVVSRQEIETGLLLRSPYIVISIADPGSRLPKIRRSALCLGILRMRFHDAEPCQDFILPPEIKLMTRRQALTAWRFVYQYLAHVQTIVVHCEAGMSRSPAVAAAVCRGLGGDDRRFFQEYQPNMHIYRLMLATKPAPSRHPQ